MRLLLLSPISPLTLMRSHKVTAGNPPHLSAANNILVIRMDRAGDTVLTTPFIRELRKAAPLAAITMVAHPSSLNLLETCPYINDLITVDLSRERYKNPYRRYFHALSFAKGALSHTQWDYVFLPQWGPDTTFSSYIAYLSKAKARIGFSSASNIERKTWNRGYDRLLTTAVESTGICHDTERMLELLQTLDFPAENARTEVWLTDEDRSKAAKTLSDKKKWAALCPGASAPKRRWPVERFAETAEVLCRKGFNIVVLGDSHDTIAADIILRKAGVEGLDMTGKCTLRETAAFLEKSTIAIANDSAPSHLAAAVGCPIVQISCHHKSADLLHSNSPARFAPETEQGIVLQPESAENPCTDSCRSKPAHCILKVGAKEVCAAIDALLT